jgi:hypothetical protein
MRDNGKGCNSEFFAFANIKESSLTGNTARIWIRYVMNVENISDKTGFVKWSIVPVNNKGKG